MCGPTAQGSAEPRCRRGGVQRAQCLWSGAAAGPPHSLSLLCAVVPVILKALTYEGEAGALQRQAPCSQGCFLVCWAFARALRASGVEAVRRGNLKVSLVIWADDSIGLPASLSMLLCSGSSTASRNQLQHYMAWASPRQWSYCQPHGRGPHFRI